MALIQCPECGAQISDKAAACIHCGFPLPQAEANAAGMEYKDLQRAKQITNKKDLTDTDPTRTSKLKMILVIVFGCVALTIALVYDLNYTYYWFLAVLNILFDLVIFGAMIFHHVLKKKTLPVILSSIGLFLAFALPVSTALTYGMSFSRYLSYRWAAILLELAVVFLLFFYTINGKKNKDSIVWFILYLVLMTIREVLFFSYNGLSIISLVHTVLFFAVGYSPDKWYRKKQNITQV